MRTIYVPPLAGRQTCGLRRIALQNRAATPKRFEFVTKAGFIGSARPMTSSIARPSVAAKRSRCFPTRSFLTWPGHMVAWPMAIAPRPRLNTKRVVSPGPRPRSEAALVAVAPTRRPTPKRLRSRRASLDATGLATRTATDERTTRPGSRIVLGRSRHRHRPRRGCWRQPRDGNRRQKRPRTTTATAVTALCPVVSKAARARGHGCRRTRRRCDRLHGGQSRR